ncbi:hypothetical protein [Paenibacillus xylanexedens]|uniref:hypothetical protein n=1 Tax=Paenibacillus xylanexedens TaxID=528191 RepID=UPI000F537C7F|nr:hypothetical protein [Paenibacillus xylanexedens]RPK27841.1 hypothetical protein EDO6_03364 [Paenibacillus xylanexedens]
MDPIQNEYYYDGIKFLEYTKLKIFKSVIEESIGHSGIEDNFTDYYSNLLNLYGNDPIKLVNIKRLFFEHIVYGRLTNIYLYRVSTSVFTKQIFLKRVSLLIDEFKVNLSNSIHKYLSREGFYLMDSINVSKSGANFIAGYDYESKGDNVVSARFLFGRNVFKKNSDKSEFLLGAVEVNFEEGTFIVYTKNPVGLTQNGEKEEEIEEEFSYSISNYHKFLKDKVSELLSIAIVPTSADKDQKGMYNFCKSLFDQLVEEPKKLVFENMSVLISKKVKQLIKKIGELGEKPTNNESRALEKKMEALLLGVYVSTNMDENSLRLKARELSLLGYPLKINYKNSRTNRSSTGTSTVKKPIASSDTLYSLLTDFENTRKLNKWSMAWFYDLQDDSDDDAIQTAIESNQKYLKITLIATRHHNKEILHHVIGNINKYR